MATILDIFRTYAGEKLVERTTVISGLQETKILEFYSAVLPAIIVKLPSEKLKRAPGSLKLIDFLESPEMPEKSMQLVNDNLDAAFIENLKFTALTSEMDASMADKLLHFATSSIFILMKEIHATNTMLDYESIKKTLLGFEQSALKEFVDCIVKNKEGAHLIDNPNKIALSEKNDDSDQSILGGYAGGR